MLKKTIIPAILIAQCLLYLNAKAQTDTSYYDLGRIRIKKEFAQSVTIKGEDLEKFPATNLTDAIAIWLSGRYSQLNGVVYVIDGDLVNDINAYSIFDIEELTWIENAIIAVNGAVQQQNLVVVKTRRNKPGKSGIEIAGQSNIINLRKTAGFQGANAPNYYHQYYVSAYQNTGTMHFGLSADYQHDASYYQYLVSKNTTMYYRNATNRFKLYGFFNTRLGDRSVLDVSINYAPQTLSSLRTLDYATAPANSTLNPDLAPTSTLFNVRASLTANLVKHLNNKLIITYNRLNAGEDDFYDNRYFPYTIDSTLNRSTKNFLLRDNLQYDIKAGDWDITPAVNFSFRSFKQDYTMSATQTDKTGYYTQTAAFSLDYKNYLLTPSLNIGYKNFFNVQGGFVTDLKNNKASEPVIFGSPSNFPLSAIINPIRLADQNKVSPFVTLSFDALRLADIPDSFNWAFFGSYANYHNYFDQTNSMFDYNAANNGPQNYYPAYLLSNYYYNSFKNFQAGSTFSLYHKRLNFAYSFEKRQYAITEENQLSYGSSFVIIYTYPLVNSQQHRASITANVLHTEKIIWQSSVNATKIINSYDLSSSGGSTYYLPAQTNAWTGGWVNQVEAGKFTAGADLLYQLGETAFTGTSKINSFVLQNAYIGYRIKMKTFKTLDVYANARNLAQNTTSDITDNRKFYGIGFKAGF